YVRLAAEALPLWRGLEVETRAPLLTITGGGDHGGRATTSPIPGVLPPHRAPPGWPAPPPRPPRPPATRFPPPGTSPPAPPARPCVAHPGAWPTFIHHGPGVYGLADPCGDVKVGLHGTGVECDPDERTFTAEPEGLARLQDYVTTWLPGLDASRPRPISCTYT